MFLLGLLLMLFPLSSQESIHGDVSCDPALISRAELSFRQRNPLLGLKTLELTQVDIKLALESCSLPHSRSRLLRRLRIVQEEIAWVHLQLADFILRADGVGLVEGALFHLKTINQNYSRFSKMDRVVFMLGDLNDRNANSEDAARYFRRVISDYPQSKFASQARKRLTELATK